MRARSAGFSYIELLVSTAIIGANRGRADGLADGVVITLAALPTSKLPPPGARFARELGVDVVVGAETAGVPLAAAVSLAAGLPFAFVRKPGYRGHEIDEPPVRGADVAGRRVLLVDDAVSSGTAVERFTASLAGVGAEVVGVFVLVDMRDVADTVTDVAAALPTESVSTYLQVLTLATANGLLDPAVHDLSVDAILNHWTEEDPRWDLLLVAA